MSSVEDFLRRLFAALKSAGVDVSGYQADHVCYRVGTLAEYESEKLAWLKRADLLHEAQISGRPIAAFRLHQPIRFETRTIRLVELPAPKPGSPYPTGWEHAEFVVPEGLAALQARYPKLDWDTSAAGKPLNPEIRLAFGAISAKFHPLSLDEVIRRETAEG